MGPLTVADGERDRIPVAAGRQRVLLAALLVRANRIVSAPELAELVWDGALPSSAPSTLRTYLTRLRHAVGPTVAQRIVTRDQGYLCRLDTDELDALTFEALCREGGAAMRASQWAEASQTLERALGLWRDEPLLDIPSQLLREQAAPRFEQLRLQALEDRVEAELALGRHDRLVLELRELATAHPLRERFHAQLMLALARSGRQAEALQVYQSARRVLIEQLGIEPGAQLRRLHERILAGDATDLAARTPARQPAPSMATPAPRPRQLPAAPGHFTGRTAELEWLTGRPDQCAPAGAGDTVVISAIDGMAGIGKTTLAVHAAHRVANRFPDGQLFLDLHGYTVGHPPREPVQALETLLRALGVPAGQIPEDTEECAALYRQRLADTRTLILLDNARDEAQVRPLLPAAPGCLVLVTSRRRLKGLDDARSLPLDLLRPTEAVALLRAVAAGDRIPADAPLLGEIAELCGYLPLALRIAGALLRHRPAWSVEHLAALLRDQYRRIRALSDGERDLGAVFGLSYTGLDEQHRTLLRRLGLLPGPDIDAYAAAALLPCDPPAATGLLEDLVDHNLLIAHAPGRYRLHDLIRAHAAALADGDPQPERDAALGRLLHYYAHTAQSASIHIARYPRPAPQDPAPSHTPALPGPEAARAWLRAERDNLEAAHTHARACALDGHELALATGLAEILCNDGPFTRALIVHQAAAETAERHGRPDARATALADLGHVRYLIGDYPTAGEDLRRAAELFRATGHRLGEANALIDLGRVRRQMGDFPATLDAVSQASNIYRATGHRNGEATTLAELGRVRYLIGDLCAAGEDLRRAVEIYRATGHRPGEANVLTSLGLVQKLVGDLPGALDSHCRALEIYRALGNRNGEAIVLGNLGDVRAEAGDYPAALDALTTALEINRAMGNPNGEADVLTFLGDVRAQTGDYRTALDHISRALELYRALGNRNNEAWALNRYAAVVVATGDLPRARTLYQQALAMNRELNKLDDQAIALEGLGECHQATDETDSAADHLRQALELFERLGMASDVDRVRRRLAGSQVA